MDLRKIKKLIELLEESKLTEIEIREGEETIRLSRGGHAATVTYAALPQATAAVAALLEPAATPPEPALPAGHAVKSPMVGTYYSAPKPGAPAFVQVGSKVAAGDVLCVIEAMKIFNQIESDKAGTVAAILKENGSPVEYGETLFIIA
jgi:acetyl-CoA carboxylase biotin carboxyl carrier protein